MGTILVVGIVAILAGAGAIGVGIQEEFIPLNLEVREPISSSELTDQQLLGEYQDLINEIPNLDKITYKIFISESTIPQIQEDYEKRLTREGYALEYNGAKTIRGVVVNYNGFVKGITGIGIFMALADSFGVSDHETVVLYTTGNVADYYLIYNWANEQSESL